MTFCRCFNWDLEVFPAFLRAQQIPVTEDGSLRQVQKNSDQSMQQLRSCFVLLSGFAHQLAILTEFHKFLPFAEHMAHGVDFYLPTSNSASLWKFTPSMTFCCSQHHVFHDSADRVWTGSHQEAPVTWIAAMCPEKGWVLFFGFPKLFFFIKPKLIYILYIYILKSQSLLSYTLEPIAKV